VKADEALTGAYAMALLASSDGGNLYLPHEWSEGSLIRIPSLNNQCRTIAAVPQVRGRTLLLPVGPLDSASEVWWKARGGFEGYFQNDAYESYLKGMVRERHKDVIFLDVRKEPARITFGHDDLQGLGFEPHREAYLVGRWSRATCEVSRLRLDGNVLLTRQDISGVLGNTDYSSQNHPDPDLLPSEHRSVETCTTRVTRVLDGGDDHPGRTIEEEILECVYEIHSDLRRTPGRRVAFFGLAALWAVVLNLVASTIWHEIGDDINRLLHYIAAH
jgi:hypothetical protein